MSEIREDAFLGGRLRIAQPISGYRAGADPVFLAASIPAVSGDEVLELGCGAGTAFLCLMARVNGVKVTGVERDAVIAKLAARNAKSNGFEAEIIEADVTDLPPTLKERSFDHVFFNPPFFDRGHGSASPNPARESGRGGDGLDVWCDTALRRLRPGGTLSLIHRTASLPQTLAILGNRLGDLRLLPLQPREARAAKLFILQGKKGAKGPFTHLPAFLLHEGTHHETDGDSYTAKASDVLRNGAAINL